ncbi:helix-turn-helix domain-containing protein [Mangrovibacterium lignilyticum]|uniref:helix-turn-helix domain-containing protein n=1 Tax=Mangrovibacterium lignilyticum TaxID=2668052 RepID=UPI0013D58677|nr:AraC family transcriptional regulator [Mangrovibacterium lignilyticum]
MIIKRRFSKVPDVILSAQRHDELTLDLYLCELTELLMGKQTIHKQLTPLNDYLLIYCTKGHLLLSIASDRVWMQKEQFCIIPKGFQYHFEVGESEPTNVFLCYFNGSKTKILEKEFTAVRDLVPSVNNLVANRKMLFDELFANLSRGYNNANMHYINFTFAHLLATFVFASRTGDDLLTEENPMVQNLISFMEQNIEKKMTLNDFAHESGYSITYLSTIFRRVTNYSPLSYFSHLKISKACEYLDQTSMKIKQIAYKMGYTDAYYFSKDFQKKMGLSPRAYRQRLKQ